MRKRRNRIKTIPLALVLLAAAAAAFIWFNFESGIMKYNHYSVFDFKLGEHIDGIDSEADARAYTKGHYEYFSDENGSGIKLVNSNTLYYLGKHLGRYCVVGVWSNEINCSVMSISVGMTELDAKAILLDNGYRMKGAGYNSCLALDGNVYIKLGFLRGDVVEIAAYLK